MMSRNAFSIRRCDALGAGVLLIALLVVTGACSPFSASLRSQVDSALTFKEVQRSPERFVGRTVMWGGVIIETQNKKSETLIKVLQTELDSSDEPTNPDISTGRFIIRSEGFLDPAVYSQGREVTVIGVVAGAEEQPIGEIHYRYPLIQAKSIKLWERPPRLRAAYPLWSRPYWYWEPYPWPYGPPYVW